VNENSSKILIGVSLVLCLVTFCVALLQPSYFGQYYYLGALVFIEVMLVALWGFSRRFFPLLIGVFLWAGIDLPLNEMWTSRRWIVLGIAAIAGFAIYIRNRRQSFSGIHLVALVCVLSAVISALVSSFPQAAVLKALSLFLLFVYAVTGARLAVAEREGKFFYGLLFACELTVWAAAVSYFVFRHALFGNPNSLGAVVGVVALPLLLWGTFISQQGNLYRRRGFSFLLGVLLLFASYSRAGIAAAVISCVSFCVCLGRYRAIIKGAAMALLAALVIASLSPIRSDQSGSLLQFIYKGDQELGVMASRNSVWDRTVSAIRQRPWFGSGFGTVATNYDTAGTSTVGFSSAGLTREHGNSYLAILEWVGLFGVIPFYALVLIVATRAAQVLIWLKRTKDPFSPAVPIALIMVAGLIHAGFEDWLFAVGYYLCVFFWSLAFILIDVRPVTAPSVTLPSPAFVLPAPGNLDLATPGQ
jgi:O-antigen ligase